MDNNKIQVAAFIDGFNLYHAIDNLDRDDLKWIDLRKLIGMFTGPSQEVKNIFYFTAIAEWLVRPAKRHKAFIKAQEAYGVTPVFGSFKEGIDSCKECNARWPTHTEKQTDVNLAVCMLREAINNQFDEAILVSRDSDFAPVLKAIRSLPKNRKIKIIAPPGIRHSKELGALAEKTQSIKISHLEHCRMPQEVRDPESNVVVAMRPQKYDPLPEG